MPHRAGAGTLDVLVAFTLLTTTLAVATPLVVRHGRLLKSQRDYRFALDELSNQMERLTTLPADKLPTALERLAPSPLLAKRLAAAKLVGDLQPAENGTRLVLTLVWGNAPNTGPLVSMAGWVFRPTRPPGTPAGGSP